MRLLSAILENDFEVGKDVALNTEDRRLLSLLHGRRRFLHLFLLNSIVIITIILTYDFAPQECHSEAGGHR